jgi:hypothetical protein
MIAAMSPESKQALFHSATWARPADTPPGASLQQQQQQQQQR